MNSALHQHIFLHPLSHMFSSVPNGAELSSSVSSYVRAFARLVLSTSHYGAMLRSLWFSHCDGAQRSASRRLLPSAQAPALHQCPSCRTNIIIIIIAYYPFWGLGRKQELPCIPVLGQHLKPSPEYGLSISNVVGGSLRPLAFGRTNMAQHNSQTLAVPFI
ncbi:unnamed protein product [Pleuronectes platessa]|uniref:Uncharacterized protein n=1 Tax=Pleuronectes platessa TaxID=8262 RepID=A0A9N7YYS2_PLEPL|nr:unnamed protein product [Pleuronectes platessa]